jgi:hypothetical protein
VLGIALKTFFLQLVELYTLVTKLSDEISEEEVVLYGFIKTKKRE